MPRRPDIDAAVEHLCRYAGMLTGGVLSLTRSTADEIEKRCRRAGRCRR